MLVCVVDIVCPATELRIQISQGPDGVSTRVNRFGDLAHVLHDLGIACQIVNKGSVGRVEEPLDNRSKSRLGLRAGSLAAFVAGEQRFKVNALKLRPPINDYQFWETVVAMNALTQRHHTGSVARFIKGEIHCQEPSGKSIGEKCRPRSAEVMSCLGINQCHIEFRMIHMNDLERTVSVPWKRVRELQVHWFMWVRSPPTGALLDLLVSGTTIDYRCKGFVTGCGDETFLCLAECDQFPIDLSLVLLFVLLIFLVNEFIESIERCLAESWQAISTLVVIGQETHIPTAKVSLCLMIFGNPPPDFSTKRCIVSGGCSFQYGLDRHVPMICLFQRGCTGLYHLSAHFLTQTPTIRQLC